MERPILFSGPMVRAILEGRKTQTRRIIRLRGGADIVVSDGKVWKPARVDYAGYVESPYGAPGDRLWVKESIKRGYCGDMSMSHYVADGFPTVADAWPWKRNSLPSIHCPRGLSRLTLEVTGVRVERLQDISEHDAEAEGCFALGECECTAKRQFSELWGQINSKRAPWASNPWVWVIEFKRTA